MRSGDDMDKTSYRFPVKPARNGWGQGLRQVWQGWWFQRHFVSLIGGTTVLGSYGPLILALCGCTLGCLLLGVAFWQGKPQSSRDNNSP